MKKISKTGLILAIAYLLLYLMFFIVGSTCSNLFCKIGIFIPVLFELPLIGLFGFFSQVLSVWYFIFVLINVVLFYLLGVGLEIGYAKVKEQRKS